MDFMTAVRTVITERYADFQGRSRRSEYWWFFLFNMILSVVANIIDAAIGVPIFSLVVFLGLIIPGIAVGIRRLHDTGRSGWWLLLSLIPIVGAIILIVWFCQRGTVGPNEWGQDPYDQPAMA